MLSRCLSLAVGAAQEAEDEHPMRWYSRDIETDTEPGEVHRFHVRQWSLLAASFLGRLTSRFLGQVAPDTRALPHPDEVAGYTGWVRECVRACLGQRDAPISNAHSARAVGAFLPRAQPRSRLASEPSDACGARV